MAEAHDLYAELGVAKDASGDQIRSAYRKLARKHHPDVNPGKPEAEEKFKRLAAAYEVLSDKEKRALYDEFGQASREAGFDPEKARAYQQWSRGREQSGARDVPFEFDLSDLMGGARAQRGARGNMADFPIDGENLVAEVQLDFLTALRGTELEVEVPTRTPCEHCAGSGDEPSATPTRCPDCGGTGRVEAGLRGPMRMVTTCPRCGGDGKVRAPCPRCHGMGLLEGTTRTRVRIPKGADEGSELRVRGKGTPGLFGGATGDLIIRTRVLPHRVFTRDGLDLRMELPVTLSEAYAGASVSVPTPGGPVQLKVPPHSQTGSVLRLRGKGVARGDTSGDLYVSLVVRLPDADAPELAATLAATSAFYSDDVRKEVQL